MAFAAIAVVAFLFGWLMCSIFSKNKISEPNCQNRMLDSTCAAWSTVMEFQKALQIAAEQVDPDHVAEIVNNWCGMAEKELEEIQESFGLRNTR